MDCSTPGLPVHHQLLELIQTHVHLVSDVIQSSHPLSSPSPPASIISRNQSFQMSLFLASGGQSLWGSVNFFNLLFLCVSDYLQIHWPVSMSSLYYWVHTMSFSSSYFFTSKVSIRFFFIFLYLCRKLLFFHYFQCVYIEFMEHSYNTW